jgi:hypothetical protein
MPNYQIRCPWCEVKLTFAESLLGQTRPCPKCRRPIPLKAEDATPVPPAAAAAPPVPPAPAAPPPPAAPAGPPPESSAGAGEQPLRELFPERMKANRALAGRTCLACGQAIDLGDDVFNCPKCRLTMHMACRERAGGCASPECAPPKPSPDAAAVPPALRLAAPGAGTDLVPCRFCREPIQVGARKCRFCGEYQSDAERELVARRRAAASGDDKLSTWEIIFGILCGGIACIVGIVYAVQGKKKGWKLILLAICAQVGWGIIQAILSEFTRRGGVAP